MAAIGEMEDEIFEERQAEQAAFNARKRKWDRKAPPAPPVDFFFGVAWRVTFGRS